MNILSTDNNMVTVALALSFKDDIDNDGDFDFKMPTHIVASFSESDVDELWRLSLVLGDNGMDFGSTSKKDVGEWSARYEKEEGVFSDRDDEEMDLFDGSMIISSTKKIYWTGDTDYYGAGLVSENINISTLDEALANQKQKKDAV